METLFRDLRYSLRTLAKNPAFTAVAVLALALGIGANTAIFSVVNAVLLRPLPYKDPDRIVFLLERTKQLSGMMVAYPDFLDWKDQSQSFEDMAVYSPYRSMNLTGNEQPERISTGFVSANTFEIIGARPAFGRTFLADEDRPGAARVVIVSHGLWQRRFGGDPDLIGKSLTLDGQSFTAIAIMPPEFSFPRQSELWVPLGTIHDQIDNRANHPGLWSVGRLKPGVTLEQAREEMDAIALRLAEQYPDTNADTGVLFLPAYELAVGSIKSSLMILLGAVSFVLLIACANVANLLLARASSRQREIAIRTALGASRLRLVRQLLTESALLSLVGGALGLFVAWLGVRALVALSPPRVPRVSTISIDGKVLAFGLVVSLLTGLIFGLVPALQTSRPDLNESLKEGGRSMTGGARSRLLRSSLVVVEVALSLVLLIGAGLMVKSFLRLQQVNPGFDAENVLVMNVSLPNLKYDEDAKRIAFVEQVIEEIKSLPGVESASVSSHLPFGGNSWQTSIVAEGQPPPAPGETPLVDASSISADYFRSMSIPLFKGRYFTEADKRNAPGVAIINESFANRFWPGEDPLGKQVKQGGFDSKEPWLTVVGVVGDVKNLELEGKPRAEVYFPYQQNTQKVFSVAARTASSPASHAAEVQKAIWAVDKDQPVYGVSPLEKLLSDSISHSRFSMLLLTIFGAIAITLAAVGVYGVISYSVAQRTHEIGIRMALGARASDVIRMIVGRAAALAVVGIAVGLLMALLVTRVMSSLLFGVSATDPATFVMTSVLLLGVALGASFAPARRATKIDLMDALRHE